MFEKVKNIICEELSIETVTEDTDFIVDLGCDSLTLIEILTEVEDTFGLDDISEEDIAGLKTVGDLVKYLESVVED